ncbi:MAG: T9SS type A sorting domain-containing protein [candidate division WOR-3 bacterium]
MEHQTQPPSIAILSNTTRQLILNIKIHGMFLQDTTIGGKTYQRILIPQEITTEKTQLTRPFFFDRIYPNPTKGMIKIRFNSPDERKITIKLYDVCGCLVHKDLIKSRLGMNEVLIRPEGLSAGIYFVRLEVENYGQMEKIILFK